MEGWASFLCLYIGNLLSLFDVFSPHSQASKILHCKAEVSAYSLRIGQLSARSQSDFGEEDMLNGE